jgi:hypothetical protein
MDNYGALPEGRAEIRDESADIFCGLQPSVAKIFFIPYTLGALTFLVTLIFFNYVLYTDRNVVSWFVLITAALSLWCILEEKGPGSAGKSVWARPIGGCCLAALVLGSIFGLITYDAYGYFRFIYNNSRSYQNTVPSEPAASVADAGRMVFASEAFVDQTKAVGYFAEGKTYCVAPVRDMVETTHVQFWAVGYDCCEWQASFNCDGAANPDARGGIVVFDSPGLFFNSNRDHYDVARKKAMASFDLKSAEKPIYVRWVANDNLDMLQKFYENRCIGCIFIFTVLYMAGSSIFVAFFTRSYFQAFFKLDGK